MAIYTTPGIEKLAFVLSAVNTSYDRETLVLDTNISTNSRFLLISIVKKKNPKWRRLLIAQLRLFREMIDQRQNRNLMHIA
jgi:hypothetical protein